MNSTMAGGCRSLFTASQWQELEHQALIFKYMMAGIPVPPDLLLFIRKSFETMATRFYHHPSTVGYCALYGKKQDPEPGRCRRTDGKKWRCSKDAYPDSKYCERHMHRGRNRSRKPVETKTPSLPPSHSQSPSSSSTVTAVTPTVSGNGGYQSAVPFHTQRSPSSSSYGPDLTQLQMDHGPSSYSVMGAKDYRCMHVVKSEEDGPSFLTRASKLDNTWPQLSSPGRNGSAMAGSYAQQHCFFGNEKYGGGGGMTETSKQESQSLRPFFDEWPKPRDSWSELEGERSNMNSISTTQLSMSIPMTSSEFSSSIHHTLDKSNFCS